MKLKSIFGLLLLGCLFLHDAKAQELNCTVQVLSPQVAGTGNDKRVFETLKTAITEFMNNTRWTNDNFKSDERIECSITINVQDRLSTDDFKATIQVQSRRPVFKASYNTVLLNYLDQDFTFKYAEFQPLEYNENAFITNLTSVLGFYANIIIGLDYDSFSLEGGTPFYQKAQAVVNNAQSANDKGWKAFEGNRNRYWLAENLANANFKGLRACIYNYHRNGLDIMATDVEGGRKVIQGALESLMKVHQISPGSFIMQQFFVAKNDEIVNIFSTAGPDVKAKLIPMLSLMDPGNGNKYTKLSGG
jgi:hypothetical protein